MTAELDNSVAELLVKTSESVEGKLQEERHPYTNNHYLFENLKKLRMKNVKEKVLSGRSLLLKARWASWTA